MELKYPQYKITAQEVKDKRQAKTNECIFAKEKITTTYIQQIMAETETVKSKREMTAERLRSRYPDEQFDDDEQLFTRINDDYEQYDNELAGYKEREGKFSDMFTSDPRSARLMMAWRDGDDPAVVLMRLYGQDIKDAIDDPEKQQAIAEANKEYMERVAKEKQYEDEYKTNLAESLTVLEKAQQAKGLSDDQIDDAMAWFIGVAKDAMMGKFTPETIEMIIKAQNYDNDVAQAGEEGEVRGKNTKVKEELRKPSRGDGTAQLDGKNGGGRKAAMPDLGAIDRYADGNMNIFERGGERRTPIKR
jgi:hypothetical protein